MDVPIMVVTKGKFYVINRKTNNVCFSYFDENTYLLFRGDTESSYMDVEQAGKDLVLCCPDKAKPAVKWESDTFVQKSVQELCGFGSAKSFDLGDLYFDSLGSVRETKIESVYRIAREVHEVKSSGWFLKYTTYNAYFLSHDGRDLEIPLVYLYGADSFEKWCKQLKVESDEIQADLWFRSKENYLNVLKDRPIALEKGVYEGLILGSEVAVKTFPHGHIFPPSCIQFWSGKESDFLLHFRGAMMSHSEYLVAFERCRSNLADFVKTTHVSSWTTVFRTLIAGLSKLHRAGIYHTNINPWNILIASDSDARLCGFSNFQRVQNQFRKPLEGKDLSDNAMIVQANKQLETKLEGQDLKDLAALIAFCYSPGVNSESEVNYTTGKQQVSIGSMSTNHPAATDAVRCLLRRASLFELLYHPWLFRQYTRIDFTTDSSELLVTFDKDAIAKNKARKRKRHRSRPPYITLHETRMERSRVDFFDGLDWTASLPNSVVAWAGPKIKPTNPLSLLRVIRNMFSHFGAVHEAVKNDAGGQMFVGQNKEELEDGLHLKFPKLTIGVYNYIKKQHTQQEIREGPMRKYYEFMFM